MIKHLKRGLSVLLAIALLVTGLSSTAVKAQSSEAEDPDGKTAGKYVSDVFIAYGRTEADAAAWLKANGWEPIKGDRDFNAGKNSYFDDAMAAVMGIRRTDKKDEAITDMAVMNMKGGYSFEDYRSLITEKKAEIDEFIDMFTPVLEEYRKNYNGEGNALGKKRADIAYNVLNRFYDGNPEGRYAVNDTGKELGELLLSKTKRELEASGESYEKLSRKEQLTHADLTQIILESSGPAMIAVEQMLALAADAGKDTFLERLRGLTGQGLIDNLEKYVPEAAGQDVAPSAALQYLETHYGDTADILAEQWKDIHEEIRWYEKYSGDNGLWPDDKETEEAYESRLKAWFEALKKKNEDLYNTEYKRFNEDTILYNGLYETEYKGQWGMTLGDFFNPADGTDYGRDPQQFLTFAAALSDGQRAAASLLSFRNLLYIGMADEDGLEYAKPDLEELFGGEVSMSIYTGINRGIFRNGAALTSKALMEQNQGRGRAFDRMWDNFGIAAITSYAAAIAGVGTLIAGAVMVNKGVEFIHTATAYELNELSWCKVVANNNLKRASEAIGNLEDTAYFKAVNSPEMQALREEMDVATNRLAEARNKGYYGATKMGVAGRVLLGIGGALLVASAAVKAWQMVEYYHRDFTPIPLLIVDEADIVTYETDDRGKQVFDENGEPKKKIDFDQYVFYEAVRCNRDKNDPLSDWQKGVEEYFKEGCGDAADLNGDFGQEWLALYTIKNEKKGDPILADSLKLQYGSDSQPKGTTKCLHLFNYTYAVDLGDTAWSFNNKKNGIYFFWDEDQGAFAETTGSTFSGGQMALAGAAGLLIGIVGTVLFLKPRRKKDEEPAPADPAV